MSSFLSYVHETPRRRIQNEPHHFRFRKSSKENQHLQSPGDSGYSSNECSPNRSSPPRKARPLFALDGPVSFDSTPVLASAEPSGLEDDSRLSPGLEADDSPISTSRSGAKCSIKQGLPCTPKSRKKQAPLLNQSRRTHSSLTNRADRFVPIRDAHSPLSEKYQTTKQSHDLSASEKLLRGHEASHDPFFSRRESNSQSSNVPRVTSPSAPRLDQPAGRALLPPSLSQRLT
jgi:hypothetical protein